MASLLHDFLFKFKYIGESLFEKNQCACQVIYGDSLWLCSLFSPDPNGSKWQLTQSACMDISFYCILLCLHGIFVCIRRYERDIWTEIAKFLDGKCLVKLGLVNRWFHRLVMEESVWKFACLRDLHVPPPAQVAFNWIQLYASAFGISRSFSHHTLFLCIKPWMKFDSTRS